MIKILVVFGTRPEAIKMAPLILEMKKYPQDIIPIVCVTGQHRDMLDQVLNLFQLSPDYDLQIMKSNQDLFDIFTDTMIGMKNVISITKPDLVLVHGDTSSSSAASLSAFYSKIPVGHVEAGLRTYHKYDPWPEEINRQINSRIASLHFAPTLSAAENLINELIPKDSILVTGNTVIDALQWVGKKVEESLEKDFSSLQKFFPKIPQMSLRQWMAGHRKMILITAHRRENFGEGFKNIFLAIKELVQKYPDVDFVFPVHLNPKVREAAADVFGTEKDHRPNLFFEEPLAYLPFVFLLRYCYLVMTDSGGIQEEAPGFGKPVLVFRETTERPEALTAGTVALVGTDPERIKEIVIRLLEDESMYLGMSQATNPYGDGKASKRIIDKILDIYYQSKN